MRTEEPVATALSESIPKFHFPQGRPQANLNIDSLISKIEKIFSQFPNERATIEEMGQVAKVRMSFVAWGFSCHPANYFLWCYFAPDFTNVC